MARLDHFLGSRRLTLIWLKSPCPQLDYASPLGVLAEGGSDLWKRSYLHRKAVSRSDDGSTDSSDLRSMYLSAKSAPT